MNRAAFFLLSLTVIAYTSTAWPKNGSQKMEALLELLEPAMEDLELELDSPEISVKKQILMARNLRQLPKEALSLPERFTMILEQLAPYPAIRYAFIQTHEELGTLPLRREYKKEIDAFEDILISEDVPAPLAREIISFNAIALTLTSRLTSTEIIALCGAISVGCIALTVATYKLGNMVAEEEEERVRQHIQTHQAGVAAGRRQVLAELSCP
ncbi:MAG: hypothetical protein QG604_254 [Candidatus Dependentiae bacterium]|nr:hypothetical protein [Candidatus Dependentiae bacterium]